MNRVKRLQADGVEIKEDRQAKKMALSQITIPTTGTLAHPRANDPIDQALVDDIVEKGGILTPLRIWEQTDKGGKLVFLCVDGSRRKRAGHVAEEILRKNGQLGKDDELWVKVEFFEGTEIEFLLARQQADGDPLKKPHVPSVIALTFLQILKIDPDFPIAKMRATCSAEYNDRIVEALTRWKSLPKEVQDAFDHGIEIEGTVRPVAIGLLPGMDKFAKEDKFEALKELVAGGYKSFAGVTKFVNTKKLEEAVAPKQAVTPNDEAEADDEADDEPADNDPAPAADKPNKSRPSKGKSHDTTSFAIRKIDCKRAYEHVVEQKAPAEVIMFAAGAYFMQGGEIDVEGFSKSLLAFVKGGCWQRGALEAGEKAPAEVLAGIAKKLKPAKPAKEPKAKKEPKPKKEKPAKPAKEPKAKGKPGRKKGKKVEEA